MILDETYYPFPKRILLRGVGVEHGNVEWLEFPKSQRPLFPPPPYTAPLKPDPLLTDFTRRA